MLSQHHHRLGVGCDCSSITAAPRQLLAVPPHPQLLLAAIPSALQHQLGVLSPPAPRSLKQQATTKTREYAGSRPRKYATLQTAKKVGRRSMMCPTAFSASSSSPPLSNRSHSPFIWHGATNTVFTFDAPFKPPMALTFPPRTSPPRPRKRGRALTDVDGEHSCLYKKKRRLRLFLITSRLSPEFSHPATNIVDRGSSKIAVWAKQKALGRNLLRKAAILNRIRRRRTYRCYPEDAPSFLAKNEREQKQLELAKLAFVYGSYDTRTRPVFPKNPTVLPTAAVRVGGHFEISGETSSGSSSPNQSRSSSVDSEEVEAPTYQSPNEAYASSYDTPQAHAPRRPHLPLPPSPLGLSNYDAFDLEDDIPDPYAHLDDDDELDEQDEDMPGIGPRSPSANIAASYTSTLSTAPTGTADAINTPPQGVYADFNMLDPEEAVFGDYDQVDEGADAIWPNGLAPPPAPSMVQHIAVLPASCSPNFTALLSTAEAVPPIQDPLGGFQLADVLDRQEQEIRKERERQRRLMFLQLNS